MAELWRMSATKLAALIRDRQVSVREVIETHLRRIEAVNPLINAVTVGRPGRAGAASREGG
jgi:amidase